MSDDAARGAQPGTEAGQHLLNELPDNDLAYDGTPIREHVLRIEAEARQQGRDRVAAEVLRQIDNHWPDLFKAHPIVAIIRRMIEDAALRRRHRPESPE